DTMSAKDPEGDALEFIIVAYPKYGTIECDGRGSAQYRYTPHTSYVGSDSFTYVARDEYGNYSTPKRVEIDVSERMSSVVYSDMLDRSEYCGAVAMTALGVMSGEQVGDETYFNPDKSVSRAEFVAMAMKVFGIRKDSTVTTSYFDDNADIPKALMGYVATAQRLGFVNGTYASGQLLFRPNDAITKYEAAKILYEISGANADGESAVFADIDTVPVWARPGVYAMYSLGIFDSADGNIYGNSAVSRAQCADYLYKLYIAVNE
ncbi:MAG: S-layer homology domain-containing protein, partial [Clostridia bacterium]|nr:S-layer homology domain-containing protein [Clostridia bacterium]